MSRAMFLRAKRKRRLFQFRPEGSIWTEPGGFSWPQHHVGGAARPFPFRRSIPTHPKSIPYPMQQEAYCKAWMIACELTPALPVFHTEI
jgi:hypothetical protein